MLLVMEWAEVAVEIEIDLSVIDNKVRYRLITYKVMVNMVYTNLRNHTRIYMDTHTHIHNHMDNHNHNHILDHFYNTLVCCVYSSKIFYFLQVFLLCKKNA